MKNLLSFLVLIFLSIGSSAQIVKNQIVLYELELTDSILKNQLDSIIFVEYPTYTPNKERKQYTYFMDVKEKKNGYYTIYVMQNHHQ